MKRRVKNKIRLGKNFINLSWEESRGDGFYFNELLSSSYCKWLLLAIGA